MQNKQRRKNNIHKNHRIYIKNKGYIETNKILEKDKVILYNGIEGLITRIEIEELEEEQTTYNFEVEDNHNYYVSEECVLVHNDCRSRAVKEAWKQEQQNAIQGKKLSRYWNDDELDELIKYGKVKGYEGHHINSVK